jgi:hypothetical protein
VSVYIPEVQTMATDPAVPLDDETKAERQARETHDAQNARETNVLAAFWLVLLAGIAAVGMFAWAGAESGVKTFAIGLLAGGAAALVGAVLGFLFGLPRVGSAPDEGVVVAPPAPPSPPAAAPPANAGNGAVAPLPGNDAAGTSAPPQPHSPGLAFRRAGGIVNNNLLEISDWLTKIIVGAGLVGLKDLEGWLGRAGYVVGRGAGLDREVSGVFGTPVLVFFFLWGFLFTYIQTRTIISLLLVTMDRSLNSLGLDIVAKVAATVKPQIDNMSEGAILQLLYTNEPGAANAAVERAHAFLQSPGNAGNGRVWIYMACGFGQQHVTAGIADKPALATRAYEALRHALTADPGLRGMARGLMYTEDPHHLPGDDDLATFREEPRFQALVGPPPA